MTVPLDMREFPWARAELGEWLGHRAIIHFGDPDQERLAWIAQAGYVPLLGRTHLELRGRDRASFLHNLCTNEVRKLAEGQGCEAFFCSVQGKVVGHALLYATPETIELESVPGAAARLMPHLERYHIREDVAIVDRGDQWLEVLLAGPQAAGVLGAAGVEDCPATPLAHATVTLAGQEVKLRRSPLAGEQSWSLVFPPPALADVCRALESAGAKPAGELALETARIEAGWPWFGVDISEQNLAPEVGRDAHAISYIKGCYLGQETIARIDALGHVNRLLVGVRFASAETPPTGLKLLREDEEVGAVTSAAWSPRLSAPLALAYVRRGSNEPGVALTSALWLATVCPLPF